MGHTKSAFKLREFHSLERQINLQKVKSSKNPKFRKPHEWEVVYQAPSHSESLKISMEEISEAVVKVIKTGMKIKSSELAEICWPGLKGRDPRRPSHHPYSSSVSMALKNLPFARRDKMDSTVWIISSIN